MGNVDVNYEKKTRKKKEIERVELEKNVEDRKRPNSFNKYIHKWAK